MTNNDGTLLPDYDKQETKITSNELEMLAQFLSAIRDVVIGQEQRLNVVENFLHETFADEVEAYNSAIETKEQEAENEVSGDDVQESDAEASEEASISEDDSLETEQRSDEEGDGVPK